MGSAGVVGGRGKVDIGGGGWGWGLNRWWGGFAV